MTVDSRRFSDPFGIDTDGHRSPLRARWDAVLAESRLTEHLPGKHDQRRHGRKGKGAGVPSREEFYAQRIGDPNARLAAVTEAKSLEEAAAALAVPYFLMTDAGAFDNSKGFENSLHGNMRAYAVARHLGMVDNKPTVTTEEEHLRLRADGEQVWYRGMMGDAAPGQRPQGEVYAEQFREGPAYYGTGILGPGIYIADGRGIWPTTDASYGGRPTSPSGHPLSAKEAAAIYARGGTGGAIIKGTVKPNARIVNYDKLQKARSRVEGLVADHQNRWDDRFEWDGTGDRGTALLAHRRADPDRQLVLSMSSAARQDSLLAGALGYQGVYAAGRSVAGGWDGDQLVIFDRSALTVSTTTERSQEWKP